MTGVSDSALRSHSRKVSLGVNVMLPKKGECTEYILLRGDLLSNLAPRFNGFLESQLTGKDVRNVSNNKYIQLCYDERIVIENRLKNGESYYCHCQAAWTLN